MNGLLTVFKKKDFPLLSLKQLSDKGLDTLSHRGDKARETFLLKGNLQLAILPEDKTAQLVMSSCSQLAMSSGSQMTMSSCSQLAVHSCSQQVNAPLVATSEGHILFFEGRLLNKKELCRMLGITDENNITDAGVVLQMLKRYGVDCFINSKASGRLFI